MNTQVKSYVCRLRLFLTEYAAFWITGITAVILAFLMSGIISSFVTPFMSSFTQGDVAQSTVRAPRDFLIEDTLSTKKRRALVSEQVARVFSLREVTPQEVSLQLEAIFSALPDGFILDNKHLKRKKTDFEIQFSVDIVGTEWDVLLNPGFSERIESTLITVVIPLFQKGIIAHKRPLRNTLSNNYRAILRSQEQGAERPLFALSDLYDVKEAHEMIAASLPEKGEAKREKAFHSLILKLAKVIVSPNVIYDTKETVAKLQRVAETVEPIYYRIRKGEVIVRAGDVISATQERRLKTLKTEISSSFISIYQSTAYCGIAWIILLALYYFARAAWPDKQPQPWDLVIIACSLITSFVFVKLNSIFGNALTDAFYYVDPGTFLLATPFAAGGMILQVTIGAAGVLMFLVSFALFSGIFLTHSWILLVLIVVGNIVASLAMRKCAKRLAFLKAGVKVAGVNLLIVALFLLLNRDYSVSEQLSRLLWAAVGGLASGILATGFTPLVEYFGKYVTDIKLLELASLDHPLLRELSLQAPGTWNHSMVISQIGESAAEAINANSLLTRVGAYYHDIGKAKKPLYFIENQRGENRHDKLTPSMSTLIIKSHVKDGVEMAQQYRLPQALIDFIPQHHGTARIAYFHDKAVREAEEGTTVDESYYRYGGPKPQSKEAGILMLADSVEAASRNSFRPKPCEDTRACSENH